MDARLVNRRDLLIPGRRYSLERVLCRIHQTLCVMPAMEAALSDHVRILDELIGLLL